MSTASKFFEVIKRFGRNATGAVNHTYRILTAKFESSMIPEPVKANIRKDILLLQDIDKKYCDQVYDATLRSISGGRNSSFLYDVIMRLNINGMTGPRAGEIARFLNNRATALMKRERQESRRIKLAFWLYSGATCEINLKEPTGQDAAHKVADGKLFDVSKGMFLDGKWTWPGVEPGCHCVSKSIIHGVS